MSLDKGVVAPTTGAAKATGQEERPWALGGKVDARQVVKGHFSPLEPAYPADTRSHILLALKGAQILIEVPVTRTHP